MMKPVTRLSVTVAGVHNLDHWLRCALTAMWAQPRGPVHLSLTQDVLAGNCDVEYERISDYFDGLEPLSRPQADAVIAALARLEVGKGVRVAILAGAGVEHDEAAARLKAVAERWSIPVATTLRAKGVFPEDHALSLGDQIRPSLL